MSWFPVVTDEEKRLYLIQACSMVTYSYPRLDVLCITYVGAYASCARATVCCGFLNCAGLRHVVAERKVLTRDYWYPTNLSIDHLHLAIIISSNDYHHNNVKFYRHKLYDKHSENKEMVSNRQDRNWGNLFWFGMLMMIVNISLV